MIDINQYPTIGAAFFEAARRFGDHSFLAVPVNQSRSYAAQGLELTYAEVAAQVRSLMQVYDQAGFGHGHRVALSLENRPDHVWHKLALNALGVCCVPVNPDYRLQELAYLIDHSKVDLIMALPHLCAGINDALEHTTWCPPVMAIQDVGTGLRAPTRAALTQTIDGETPASILYTSGTTGSPKGCILSHRYELASGAWYARLGGLAAIRLTQERLYNPLPLFHVNASILSFYCMMLTGNCQIQTDRFQPTRWWEEVRQSDATIVHYLGIIIPLLLAQPADQNDQEHGVRFGFGAGVEPQLHAVFEARFGIPLLEIWGMTEMVRTLVDCEPPRQVGTRAFGRPRPGVDVKVVDGHDQVVPSGTPGEMLIRHSAQTPRQDFFLGYLDDEAATAHAWRNGWFHTGDIVVQDPDGMIHFFDRDKHIIRRSGENISAAQVEAVLQTHPWVQTVAVLPVADEIREQEVLACVVLSDTAQKTAGDLTAVGHEDKALALFEHCYQALAYYKAPGWILFLDSIPTTATQKIQKHRIFSATEDPRQRLGIVDCRDLKKRHQKKQDS
uniref:AMP-binding protein n=1 Tax=Orrella sp. TaxID=1921583 RepID=UPI0040482615